MGGISLVRGLLTLFDPMGSWSNIDKAGRCEILAVSLYIDGLGCCAFYFCKG
jgi:hypothetical protein